MTVRLALREGRQRMYFDTVATSCGDVDYIAVERVANGDDAPRPRLSAEEKMAVADLMHRHGVQITLIAERLHVSGAKVREMLGFAPPARKLGPPVCGTRRGYRAHLRLGEPTCADCRAANAAADRRLNTTGTTVQLAA